MDLTYDFLTIFIFQIISRSRPVRSRCRIHPFFKALVAVVGVLCLSPLRAALDADAVFVSPFLSGGHIALILVGREVLYLHTPHRVAICLVYLDGKAPHPGGGVVGSHRAAGDDNVLRSIIGRIAIIAAADAGHHQHIGILAFAAASLMRANSSLS